MHMFANYPQTLYSSAVQYVFAAAVVYTIRIAAPKKIHFI